MACPIGNISSEPGAILLLCVGYERERTGAVEDLEVRTISPVHGAVDVIREGRGLNRLARGGLGNEAVHRGVADHLV